MKRRHVRILPSGALYRNARTVVAPAVQVAQTTYYPYTYDTTRNCLLVTNGALGNKGPATKLYTTTDGTNLTEIADATDVRFRVTGFTSTYICSCCVLNNGDYLLCIMGAVASASYDVTYPISRLFRSADGGTTWVACTFTHGTGIEVLGNDIYAAKPNTGLPYGFVPQWGWNGHHTAPDICIPEYGNKSPGNAAGPRCAMGVYVSHDYGVTWTLAHHHDETAESHCHLTIFEPGSNNTRLWTSCGDGFPNSRLVRLDYADGVWSVAHTIGTSGVLLQPITAVSANGKLYFGHDGSYGSTIWRLNLDDLTITDVFNVPDIQSSAYTNALASGYCWFLQPVAGAYWACTDGDSQGIWVSHDCETWIPFARAGVARVAGVLNNRLYVPSTDGGHLGRVYNAPRVRGAGYVRTRDALTNRLGATSHATMAYSAIADMYGTSTSGKWLNTDAAYFTLALAPAAGPFDNNAVRLTRKSGEAWYRFSMPRPGDYIAGAELANGDIITATLWVKPEASWPSGIGACVYSAVTAHGSVTVRNYVAQRMYKGQWTPLSMSWQIVDATDFDMARVRLRLQFTDTTPEADYSILLGALQYVLTRGAVSRSLLPWPEFMATSVPQTHGVADVSRLGGEWTIVFCWRPVFGVYNFHTANCVLPIATLVGETGALELYWENNSVAGPCVYLQSAQHGGAGGRSGGAVQYVSHPSDLVHVVMRGASNLGDPSGKYTAVDIYDPVYGFSSAAPYTLGDDGSKSLFYLDGLPQQLLLGVNSISAVFGESEAYHVRTYNGILTNEQVAVELNRLTARSTSRMLWL